MKPTPMGFWKTEYEAGPDARRAEVETKIADMTIAEVAALLDYMGNATVYQAWRGYASCRICDTLLGTTDMLTPDGKFLFPDKWEHYITAHSVRPDEDFIKAALEWVKNPVHWDDDEILQAANHADEVSMRGNMDERCAQSHRALATWLRELYSRRKMR